MAVFACDTETTGLDIIKDKPFLMMAYNGQDYVVERKINKFLEIVSNPENITIWHNLKFDLHMLANVGIEVKAKAYCTLVASHLLDENRPQKSLKYLTKTILKRSSPGDEILEKYFKDNKIKKEDRNYKDVPWKIMEPYAKEDVKNTFDLWQIFEPQLIQQDLMELKEREGKLCSVLMRMEKRGVLIDKNKTLELETKLDDLIVTTNKRLYDRYGYDWSITSNQQIGRKLHALGVTMEYTAHPTKPQFLVNAKALERYDHPLAKEIIHYRKLCILRNTFCKSFLKLMDENHIIRASFLSWGTKSGRFSCKNPNLQQTPKPNEKNEVSTWIRALFIPRPGFFNLYVDYDQIEYRIMASYAKDKKLIEDINNGVDVHKRQAQKVFRTDKPTKEQRNIGKTLNFAMLYGAGAKGLANILQIDQEEAKEYVRIFWEANHHLARLRDKIAANIRQRGYIFNKFKRRYRLTTNQSFLGINYLGQGSNADLGKDAMVELDKLLKDQESNMLLTVHDEIVFEIKHGEEFLMKDIKRIMTEKYTKMFGINIEVSFAYSNVSWADKKELDV